jgi:diaminopimelate decarboxylase
LLRLSPGIDPHTHHHTTTGVIDSKFGFPIATGQAEEALKVALSSANLRLVGLHVHLGSPIFELEPYKQAVEVVLRFAAEMAARHGFQMAEFSPGGGFAVQYVRDTPAPPTAAYAEAICSTLLSESPSLEGLGLPPPRLIVEPGRAIVARAGVALYRVGASKDIPGVRRYVSVDGGMADNIRPALYGARYEAVVANKAGEGGGEPVTIAGKFCESGDILIKDVRLPRLKPGDLIAVPVSGAYCPSMASNYNASLKPAIVMVKEGQARLVRRRETYQDLVEHDLI